MRKDKRRGKRKRGNKEQHFFFFLNPNETKFTTERLIKSKTLNKTERKREKEREKERKSTIILDLLVLKRRPRVLMA